MPTKHQQSAAAKRVKARIAIRRARHASPAEIAQYALYASQQWRLRDLLFPFLTSAERDAFERLEQYHQEQDATPTSVSPLPPRDPQSPKRCVDDVCQVELTQARVEGLDAVVRLIVTQPRSIAQSMPFYDLYDSEKQAIEAFSERLHREGKLAAAVCEALACSHAELKRWSSDGRLPSAGWRHVYYYRSRWEEVWFVETLERAKPQVAAWRDRDTLEFERRSAVAKMSRSRREDV